MGGPQVRTGSAGSATVSLRGSETQRHRRRLVGAGVCCVLALSATGFSLDPVAAAGGCAPLTVLGIQGTGQSSPDAPVNVDTGFLAEVMKPLLAQAGSLVKRMYVPYEASFGGAGPSTPGQTAPYSVSVSNAGNRAVKMMEDEAARCPNTMFALTGYSQGAHAVRGALNMVLQGQSRIRPEQIAAVANFGDPGRPGGASLFPGKPGQVAPAAVPGTSGVEVSKVRAASANAPTGGGIGPSKDQDVNLAKVAGRYASFCADGDLACDAPTNTALIGPLVHLVTNVGGQMMFDQNDPIRSISTIGQALAQTVVKAVSAPAPVAAAGPEAGALPVFSSIAKRLEYASDPRSPMPELGKALTPAAKSGLLGGDVTPVNAVRELTSQSVWGAASSAGASSPTQIAGALAPQIKNSAVSMAPPLTADLNVLNAYQQTKDTFTNPLDLMNIVGMFGKYNDVGAKHTSYGKASSTPTGMPPTVFTAKWFAAAAKDIASGTKQNFPALPALPPPVQAIIGEIVKPLPALPGALSAAGLPPQVANAAGQAISALPTPTATAAPTTTPTDHPHQRAISQRRYAVYHVRQRVSNTHQPSMIRARAGDLRYWWRYTVSVSVVSRRSAVVVIGSFVVLGAFVLGAAQLIAAAANTLPSPGPASAPRPAVGDPAHPAAAKKPVPAVPR